MFSAPVYIRGFVRIYAGFLEANVSQILSDLDAELAKTEKFRDDPALVEHPRTALDVVMFQFSKLNGGRVPSRPARPDSSRGCSLDLLKLAISSHRD